MKLERRYTKSGQDPLDQISYENRTTVIANPDGSEVFRMENLEVPISWSQLATDIVASKYFRKRGVPHTGHETSAKQVVHRVAYTIRKAGEELGHYFDTPKDAETFEAELAHHLINQMGAFNSPVWFNCGLYQEYGIKGNSVDSWYWDHKQDSIFQTKDSYSHPQCSACYIQSVNDDLMSIFDLLKSEARLFKFGSGTGSNFSSIRGSMEKLSGGGTSSGLMSFLEVLDKGAGATKSGGITRRAAKMVCLDIDHPEITNFINWKANEERKVAALIKAGYSSDFNGEAYRTVSGQNSNNSVRIPDKFMEAYLEDGNWSTHYRTNGEIHKTYKSRNLMRQIAQAAWECADPGVQYDTTINKWHTSSSTNRINSSNPCSEYMYLDDSACNLASINLMHFLQEDGSFDIKGFRHACKLFILAQEILVDFASYPTKTIAKNSHDYRPLGLGYANLGTLLMVSGLPYNSPEARAICGAITAVMCGQAYATSAQIAADKGPFPGFEKNRKPMLKVINQHRDAVNKIDPQSCPPDLLKAAQDAWDSALELGQIHGYRNGQTTVIAPTGTIGLMMDCDTTGIEPDFALVKFKKLAGGGYFKIVNASVPKALKRLGYSQEKIQGILTFICGTLSLSETPHINRQTLQDKGLTEIDLKKVGKMLPSALDLSFAFTPPVLGEKTFSRLGFTPEEYKDPEFKLLEALGFSISEIKEANDVICGRMTIEGAPYIKEKHLAVFDCANKCGRQGKRFISPMAHLTMMAAAQKFISGAISKTVNVPNETTVEEIESLYIEGWKLDLKAVALYRDGSKLSQPLNSSSNDRDKENSSEKVETNIESEGDNDLTNQHPIRKRLPLKRQGFTQEARVAGHKVFLRTGEYEDGTLGEIFVDMHKEGAPFRSMLNCFAIAVSKGLQYGVPLEEFVDTFTFTRFEPWGTVDHPNIKFSTSVLDYIFRLLGYEYQGRTDFLQVKPEDLASDIDAQTPPGPKVEPTSNQTLNSSTQKINAQTVTDQQPITKTTTTSPIQPLSIPPTNGSVPSINESTKNEQNQILSTNVLGEQLSQMMGDAPFCDTCGHITVRNGSCYRCLNCGNSMGCS